MTSFAQPIRFLILLLTLILFPTACQESAPVQKGESLATPELLSKHCNEMIGKPRVERISQHVWAAIGYDLASAVLIHTPVGNVIVDAGMSIPRARAMRRALEQAAPKGPVKALIYTHSHIDHVGGASAWVDKDTPIWATDALPDHLLKQYQVFLPIERIRGRRQFGHRVSLADLPCSALGRRTDIDAAVDSGMLLPNHTFSGKKVLSFGGMKIEMIEADGETHDQLFVWIPEDKTLIAGDNFYWCFPNLYTIRGTSPRPVDSWIDSLDRMRSLEPEHLIGNHTKPIQGKQAIARALTNYRDAIQWVRDQVVRGANQGLDVDTLAETIKLPPHLAKPHYNKELYGQLDWSVRAIYSNHLGWFDGRADRLYPLASGKAAAREIELMGGEDKVMELAAKALKDGDTRWAVHLLAKLRTSGLIKDAAKLNQALAAAYEAVAAGVFNTNGRGYLLERAKELRQGPAPETKIKMQPALVSGIPLKHIFQVMTSKLKPESAMDVHETLVFKFTDEKQTYYLTIRNGICELALGQPLPGAPEPVGTITMNSLDYRKMALGIEGPVSLYTDGKINVDGSWLNVIAFLRRFERG